MLHKSGVPGAGTHLTGLIAALVMSDDILNGDELEEAGAEEDLLGAVVEDAPEGTIGEEDIGLALPSEDDELDAFGFHKEEEETF